MTVSLVIGGALVLVMICISGYGAISLPGDARIPIHRGLGSFNQYAPKPVGLVVWPAAGALIYGLLFLASRPHAAGGGSHGGPVAILMPVILASVAAVQAGAIAAARRGSGISAGS